MRLCSPDSVSSDDSVPRHVIPIQLHQKTGYSAYESSPSDVRFSKDYIEQLTVGQLMAPDLIPQALPDGAVQHVGWSVNEPTTSQFLLIDGKIPSLSDVRTFLSSQPTTYREGFRSVVLEAQGTYLLIAW
jgi:hypothetical protein